MKFDNWRQWLNQTFRRVQARRTPAVNRFRPSLEPLEDRLVPAATTVSILNTTPASLTTNATSITYTVVFGAATTGLTTADLFLTGTAGISQADMGTPTTTNSVQWTETITGGDMTGARGTLILELVSAAGLSNTLTNTLPVAGPTYTLMPVVNVTSITHTTPASLTTNASSVTYTLTFSAATTGLTAANFSVTGTAGVGTVGVPSTSDGGIHWSVPITGLAGANGTLILNLANSTGLNNTVSNTLPLAGDTYTLNSAATAPAITSAATTGFTAGLPGSFQVTTSTVTAVTYNLTGAPAWLTINAATGLLTGTPPLNKTSLVQTVTFTINATNGITPDAALAFTLKIYQPRRRGI